MQELRLQLEQSEERAGRLQQQLEEQRAAAAWLRDQLDAGTDRERIVGILEASFQVWLHLCLAPSSAICCGTV